MTIVEALGRQYSPRPTKKTDWSNNGEEEYNRELLKKGIAIFREANIPDLLTELQKEIRKIHPDVKTENGWYSHNRRKKYTLVNSGIIQMGVGWNYKYTKRVGEGAKCCFNTLKIAVQPLNKTLVVIGNRCEFIPENIWNSSNGKIILEDALVNAYRNPGTVSWPPAMI